MYKGVGGVGGGWGGWRGRVGGGGGWEAGGGLHRPTGLFGVAMSPRSVCVTGYAKTVPIGTTIEIHFIA